MSTKQESRFASHILKPEVRKTSDLPYHNDLAPGKRRVFLEKSLFPEADLYVMVRTSNDVSRDQPEYVESHAHNVSSVYVFIGHGPDLEGLTAEVILDGEVFHVESPATVYIPAEVVHSYRLIEGSGHFSHIVLRGEYNSGLSGWEENEGERETNNG